MENEYHKMTRPARELAALMELNSVTKQNLQDPDAREALVEMLFENGILPHRSDCGNFVELLADYAAGVPLVPSMRAWLDESKACCAQWLKAQSVRDVAWEEQTRLNSFRLQHSRMLESIALERQRLAELTDPAGDPVGNYIAYMVGNRERTIGIVCDFASKRLAELEAGRFIRDEIIPRLEKDLAALDNQISAYTAAIGAGDTLPEMSGA